MKIKIIWVAALLVMLYSCKTKEKTSNLDYMQNIEQMATNVALAQQHSLIQPGDQLVIFISAKDPDVVMPFNQGFGAGAPAQMSNANSNSSPTGQTGIAGPIYTVDSEGTIEFPFLGKMEAQGKSLETFREILRQRLQQYIISPTVNIRYANYKVTVLGEVKNPGTFLLPDGNANILSALGLAGDLTVYGVRDNVLVLRNVNGEIRKERINLQDANFIYSDFYQLRQNDVILVAANQTKEKESRMNPNTPLYISAAGIVVTILALVFRK